jgi:hypothetical protein
MTPRVREILSWYGAHSAGTLTNLARLPPLRLDASSMATADSGNGN